MSFDFFKGVVEINYNRVISGPESSAQDQRGWTEDYFFPVGPGVATTRSNMRNLVAARASLLPKGAYIFRAGFGQASVHKSHYSLNGNAINPVPVFNEGWSQTPETCNDVEAGVLWRFEDGAGRRWQRLVACLRDSWISDMFGTVGSYAYDPVSGMAAPQVAGSGGVVGTATTTVTSGAISAITITGGGSGYTVAPTLFVAGGSNTARATAVLTAGVITSVTGLVGGSGYSGTPTVFVPAPQYESWGLMAGQANATLMANFLSCVANYCINFHSVRETNLAFPSGKMTQGDTIPTGGTAGYVPTRILYQKVSDKDRGSIRTTGRGRRKIAI